MPDAVLQVCLKAPVAVRTALRDDLHLFLGRCLSHADVSHAIQKLLLSALIEAFPSLLDDKSDLSVFDMCAQLLLSTFPLHPTVCK